MLGAKSPLPCWVTQLCAPPWWILISPDRKGLAGELAWSLVDSATGGRDSREAG